MKDILHLISEYSIYSNLSKIPFYKDALIHPIRCHLYTTFLLTKNGKKAKSTKVLGDISNDFYVHGDASLYKTLANLVNRKFLYNATDSNHKYFIDGMDEGWGNIDYKLGVQEAAAFRYTNVKCNQLLTKDFSNILNKKANLVNFQITKQGETAVMPEYLPFIVPLGLIGNSISTYIGGLNAFTIPQYKLIDLLQRQYDLITKGSSDNIIKPFIERNYIKEKSPNAFLTILTEGHGKIDCIPIYKIDDVNNQIIVRGMHPRKGFGDITKKITDNTKATSIKVYNAVYKKRHGQNYFIATDYTDKNYPEYNDLYVTFKPAKGIKWDDEFKNRILKLLSDPITFDCSFNIEDKSIKRFSIDELLIFSFNDYCRIKKLTFENELSLLNSKLKEMKIAIAIKDVYDTNISEIQLNSKLQYNKIIEIYTRDYLNKKYFFTTLEFISILDKIKFKDLVSLNINIEPIEKQIEEVKVKIISSNELSLKDLESMIMNVK